MDWEKVMNRIMREICFLTFTLHLMMLSYSSLIQSKEWWYFPMVLLHLNLGDSEPHWCLSYMQQLIPSLVTILSALCLNTRNFLHQTWLCCGSSIIAGFFWVFGSLTILEGIVANRGGSTPYTTVQGLHPWGCGISIWTWYLTYEVPVRVRGGNFSKIKGVGACIKY